MIKKAYYGILAFIIINFVTLIAMIPKVDINPFIMEVFVILLFMVMAAVLLYMTGTGRKFGWAFSTFFFSLNLMNAVYIFFFLKTSSLIVVYAASSLAGFILSVYKTDRATQKNVLKVAHNQVRARTPKVVIEDIKEEKAKKTSSPAKQAGKQSSKKTAKKSTKKKPAKKAAKKSSKKKTAKKASKKTSKKK